MSKKGKKYKESAKHVDRQRLYSLEEGIDLAKKTSYSKFVGSLELVLSLGVDPRHADQNVKGAIPLPHGLGKTVRVVVFAKGQKAVEAQGCEVEFVGGDDLADKIQAGWLDFDAVVATPDMMAVVGKLGRVLGPRGLMPNPRMGTVTFNVAQAVNELKSGKAEFKVDKAGIVHVSVGKVDMESEKLKVNATAVIDAVLKAKPQSSKGTYLKKVSLSATMGPGIKIDSSLFKN